MFKSIEYCFQVTLTFTLTSDLSYTNIVPGAYFYIVKGRTPKFSVWIYNQIVECCILFTGHCDDDLWHQFYTI